MGLVIVALTHATTSATSVSITITMEIMSIVTLVIEAPAYVTVNATSVITTTMEIMLTATLVIVALTPVIISVASVITITTTVATLEETVASLTVIPAVVLMSAVK